MSLKKQLDLYIEVDVLTAGTTAEVVNAILESLLYQRNQIPFVYKTYRYYVNKWLEQEQKQSKLDNEICGVQSFQVQRKKQQATATKEAISAMRETIKKAFEKKPIKSLRFLFGSTIFTAKECYTLHIPTENIAMNHFHDHHSISPAKLNQTLLSLLTSEDLYGIFSHNLNPTNMYLELEIMENENPNLISSKEALNKSQIFPKDFSSLPASCKDIHIHLMHKPVATIDYKQLKCCKDLQVFEDLISLNLDDASERQDNVNNKLFKSYPNSTPAWWEAEIVIRGFKDQPTKGFNIWS
ncbi:uncharacterized protein LOC119605459 [Lucilia sericata]|uniref:uncharacterized protein LOC119605459 n=1 Tax=Lucilia sericata TaxID=13632 RepID=UPI0018A8579F|nr:uncharacterized protein LOC119605459 [Lucilia sericata]